ncbi:PhoX family phosphatase [Luteimonas sp. RD2P54]|uniref:PhoX family phosphatase n=1 Tax=Luteimonas endophytica TaxID=3042023 RepID=A0ABT6J5K9_9GAMM|nr:PhoX family phosphatase [Luteimonas endophytica]MDH5821513.1 PhoX family phosphatase [Luteimonas endophytica]
MTEQDRSVAYGDRDFDHEDSNRSGNTHFADVLRTRMARRRLLQGGLGLAMGAGLFGAAAAAVPDPTHARKPPRRPRGEPLGFSAVPVGRGAEVVVPPEYAVSVILPWGEPITGSYPRYLDGGLNSGADQEQQVGMHHDGMHFFPLQKAPPFKQGMGLLVMNHEYIDQAALHADGPVDSGGRRDPGQVRKEIAAHGVSVVEIRRRRDTWETVRGRYNRRITGATPMEIAGPARGHRLLRTAYSPEGTRTRGTLNNCAHGHTPWRTYLTCEENWAGYFVNRGERPREHARYGVATSAGRYGWETVEPRFDATALGDDPALDYRNEPNHFGWIVEIDPFDPDSTPVKRTALGRFAHEGLVFAQPRPGQRLVAYMGDDAQNEYVYRFVSRDSYVPGSASGALLDHGTLYVARFADDGSGEWRPLDIGDPGFAAAAAAAGVRFEDQADVLVNTRLAADVAGATPMDRAEWGAVDPRTGEVYFTLTNNSSRSAGDVDGPNPRGPNAYGHVIRFMERGDWLRFDWDVFLLSGPEHDSLGPDGAPLGVDAIHASPDGLWFDAHGLLWIQTDMSGSQLGSGPFGNNQMLVADPASGAIKRFLVGPPGCEVTGVVTTPDSRTMFVNIQHPAESGGGGWPGGMLKPRSATLVVTRRDGGVVGT